MTEHFITARIGSPFGLTGRVRIESLSGEESHLFDLKKVQIRKEKTDKENIKEYIIEEVFASPLSIKLKGIDSPEAAKTINGAEILISMDQAAPLREGEFYIEDLRGLEVIADGKTIGVISDLIEGGGGFLAELILKSGTSAEPDHSMVGRRFPSGEKRLVPFRNEFFGTIDQVAGRVELLNSWIIQ